MPNRRRKQSQPIVAKSVSATQAIASAQVGVQMPHTHVSQSYTIKVPFNYCRSVVAIGYKIISFARQMKLMLRRSFVLQPSPMKEVSVDVSRRHGKIHFFYEFLLWQSERPLRFSGILEALPQHRRFKVNFCTNQHLSDINMTADFDSTPKIVFGIFGAFFGIILLSILVSSCRSKSQIVTKPHAPVIVRVGSVYHITIPESAHTSHDSHHNTVWCTSPTPAADCYGTSIHDHYTPSNDTCVSISYDTSTTTYCDNSTPSSNDTPSPSSSDTSPPSSSDTSY
ncbi:uncharacterized protein VTP21DRAFT_5345 [Calcarisporiella thermophila]|uniref:uncharacterized protein n=1 Tax=Calcarisporiella thermophila TaxID=911321 RepID=UPI0037435857